MFYVSLVQAPYFVSGFTQETATMFDSLRDAASRKPAGSRSRVPIARRPSLESLEQRELLSTLVLPTQDPGFPRFYTTRNLNVPGGTVLVTGHGDSGGNFFGTLDGTPLTATYCVDINFVLSGTTYNNATSSGDGTAYGNPVPKAGAISWLLTNIGPKAITPVQQDALQAAIWRTEYGESFQVDGVDNTNGAPVALGTNTAPVGNVLWISPGANPDKSTGQALVALPGTSTPPPPPPRTQLQVTGIAVAGQTKKGLTSFNVAFNEAVNTGSASNVGHYHVFASVKKRGKATFSKALTIRDVVGGGSTATINLAKPHKGLVQVTVDPGIVAANGTSTSSPFSMVLK
jgi:hypothetical protein